jgi:hypothetical protein
MRSGGDEEMRSGGAEEQGSRGAGVQGREKLTTISHYSNRLFHTSYFITTLKHGILAKNLVNHTIGL